MTTTIKPHNYHDLIQFNPCNDAISVKDLSDLLWNITPSELVRFINMLDRHIDGLCQYHKFEGRSGTCDFCGDGRNDQVHTQG